MCNGPEDTPKNIIACCRKATTLMLTGMLEDWQRSDTSNSVKMADCIRKVLAERRALRKNSE